MNKDKPSLGLMINKNLKLNDFDVQFICFYKDTQKPSRAYFFNHNHTCHTIPVLQCRNCAVLYPI